MDSSTADAGAGRLILEAAKVEYRWIGERRSDRPEIVLLHEGLGSVSSWRAFPERLAEATRCAVFTYSRPGYGCSDPIQDERSVDYMHREAQDVLPRVLSAANIDRPILFGHSDGASIALLYAATYQQPPLGLILEAPHVFVEPITVRSIADAQLAFRDGRLRDALARHHADPEATFSSWSRIWLSPDFRDWNIEDQLGRIRCPILLIQALDDPYGTTAQLEAIIAATPATDSLVLAEGGHAPHKAEPEAVLERAAAFVASCARRHEIQSTSLQSREVRSEKPGPPDAAAAMVSGNQ